ncbi:MAG: dimethylsulfonioproprionate lyase family protein [Gammaproteobacteria bacterium]|nr:dimethylsulfonioproprionate lyase family protein [Gammaproteobacteria bacterium]
MIQAIATQLENLVLEYLVQMSNQDTHNFLENWPTKPLQLRHNSPKELAVLHHLRDININTNSKASTLVQKLQKYADRLYWGQTYSKQDFGAIFMNNYGWTELIGTRGPIVSNEIACGFLLLGPNTHYPGHSHEAEEFYMPLTQALWKRGGENWQLREPELAIYHRPWVPHSMKTNSEPLLALYIWRGGDLAQKSCINPP